MRASTATEVPLLQAAAHIGVGQGLHHLPAGHLGKCLDLAPRAALGQLQRLISTRHHSAFTRAILNCLLF